MKYFARIDRQQVGPLSLTELVKAGVRPSTYVWAKGMADWTRAEDVPEICRAMRRALAGYDPETGDLIPRYPESGESIKRRPGEEEDADLSRMIAERRIGLHGIPEQPDRRDYSIPPQGVSVVMAVIVTIMCFPVTGIVAIWFAMKSKADWRQSRQQGLSPQEAEDWRRKAHDDARIYRMMIGITFSIGLIVAGFAMMRMM